MKNRATSKNLPWVEVGHRGALSVKREEWQQRLCRLVWNLPAAVALVDPAGNVQCASSGWTKVHRVSPRSAGGSIAAGGEDRACLDNPESFYESLLTSIGVL